MATRIQFSQSISEDTHHYRSIIVICIIFFSFVCSSIVDIVSIIELANISVMPGTINYQRLVNVTNDDISFESSAFAFTSMILAVKLCGTVLMMIALTITLSTCRCFLVPHIPVIMKVISGMCFFIIVFGSASLIIQSTNYSAYEKFMINFPEYWTVYIIQHAIAFTVTIASALAFVMLTMLGIFCNTHIVLLPNIPHRMSRSDSTSPRPKRRAFKPINGPASKQKSMATYDPDAKYENYVPSNVSNNVPKCSVQHRTLTNDASIDSIPHVSISVSSSYESNERRSVSSENTATLKSKSTSPVQERPVHKSSESQDHSPIAESLVSDNTAMFGSVQGSPKTTSSPVSISRLKHMIPQKMSTAHSDDHDVTMSKLSI